MYDVTTATVTQMPLPKAMIAAIGNSNTDNILLIKYILKV